MFLNNFVALIITALCAIVWLRLNDFAAHKGWISSQVSRKIIHAGTGPIFVTCWLLFNNTSDARFLAATIPLIITAQFILVGIGIIGDPAAVKAMSRSGDRREILRGPLFYGSIFVIITLLYWYDSPIGIIALMLMCGGDGLADILGRRFGRHKLPWNKEKSWIGSLGMFSGGWIFSFTILSIYLVADKFAGNPTAYFLPLTIISLVGALVESLPLKDIDNITITLAALATGHLVF